MTRDRCAAFAPGRVNVIGEHTDYNDGLSLPFAVEQGVTVRVERLAGTESEALAHDLGEHDRFDARAPAAAEGWRAFVRGVVAELHAAGHGVPPARIEISSTLAQGSGLSSSAALTVGLSLALLGLAGEEDADRVELARLCSRVERTWVGAQTGLLDQLASLLGRRAHALRLDFRTLEATPVALDLGDWTLATVDSGEQHSLAASGYNDRRRECREAAERLGVASLRDARAADAAALEAPLGDRVLHVLEENDRVDAAVRALAAGDLAGLGRLLDASHASLRDRYSASTPAVEATVDRLRAAGAAGARMMGGGFGGHVLALLPPGAALPDGAVPVAPAQGARLIGAAAS